MSNSPGWLKKIKEFIKGAFNRNWKQPLKKDIHPSNPWFKNMGYGLRNALGGTSDIFDAGLKVVNMLDPMFNDPIIGGAIELLESGLSKAKMATNLGSQMANYATTGQWDWRKDGTLPGVNAFAEDGFKGLIWNLQDTAQELNQKPYSYDSNHNYLNPGNRLNITRPNARVYGQRSQKPVTQVTRPKWK